jgi:hypothetical protein
MAKKEELTPEQLAEKLAAAEAKAAELEAVVEGQNEELERLGAEKSAGAKVISVGKKKYKVLVPKCVIPTKVVKTAKGREIVEATVTVVTADLEKKENKELLNALLAVPGQAVLQEV